MVSDKCASFAVKVTIEPGACCQQDSQRGGPLSSGALSLEPHLIALDQHLRLPIFSGQELGST